MTYLSFLLLFILVPFIINVVYLVSRHYSYRTTGKPTDLVEVKIIITVIIIIAIIALIYTTPWDNFLVANNIWHYDANKVLGIIIGYVPIEEYSFFILQTFLVGVFTYTFIDALALNTTNENRKTSIRILASGSLFLLWLAALITYIAQINYLVYLDLILIWGLPPIILQLLYGADILWEKKHFLVLFILTSTIYLAVVDALAISANIWTIALDTSTGILIGGILPIEEFLFFLVTNVLIIFGLTLILSRKSIIRFRIYSSKILAKIKIEVI
ncbi:MAG: lycopene cyclase domain-containing protein [Candidatus Thorarchaeota archaeon]